MAVTTLKQAARTLTDYWAQIDALRDSQLASTTSTLPPGGFTLTQYAERYSVPRSTAREQLVKLVTAGKLKPFLYREPGTRTVQRAYAVNL